MNRTTALLREMAKIREVDCSVMSRNPEEDKKLERFALAMWPHVLADVVREIASTGGLPGHRAHERDVARRAANHAWHLVRALEDMTTCMSQNLDGKPCILRRDHAELLHRTSLDDKVGFTDEDVEP